jgi:hypothetical protein
MRSRVPQRRSSKARTSSMSAAVGMSESCTSRSSDSKPVAICRMRDSRSLAAPSSQRPSLSISTAGGGERHARAVALEQLHAQLLLELADRVRDGGGHLVQARGGGRERAVAVDGVDHLDGFQAELEHAGSFAKKWHRTDVRKIRS